MVSVFNVRVLGFSGATPILQELDPVYYKMFEDKFDINTTHWDLKGVAQYKTNDTYFYRDPPTGAHDQVRCLRGLCKSCFINH